MGAGVPRREPDSSRVRSLNNRLMEQESAAPLAKPPLDTRTTPLGTSPPETSRRREAQTAGLKRPRQTSIKAWTGLGPIHSLRGGLLLVAVMAVAPLTAFASGMALLRAADAHHLPTMAAWITVSALPLLIGVGAVVVVGVAAEAMVMRWLSYLERLSRAYAHGRYSLRPRRLQQAPLEFRALGEAVEDMAAAVEHRDQALRDALDEQTVLLREVHHRVKNNLQIVASLLSLQASRADDPAVREALQDTLVRIDAMSLSQRFMKQHEDEDRVAAVELFEALIVQVRARLGSAARTLSIVADIEPFILSLDAGSRLVLAAAEAMICAFRAAAPHTLHGRLTVRRQEDGVSLTLTVQDQPDAFADAADRVSRNLINGYVRQLRGRLQADPGSGSLSLFAPMSLQDAGPEASNATQSPKFFRILDRTHSGVAS
jgi:two-component sensor histidine kinase